MQRKASGSRGFASYLHPWTPLGAQPGQTPSIFLYQCLLYCPFHRECTSSTIYNNKNNNNNFLQI